MKIIRPTHRLDHGSTLSRLQPYDYVGALSRLGGDTELFRQVAEIFATDSNDLVKRLRSAVDHDDRKSVAMVAHSLVGLAGTFSAKRVTAAAARIELGARNDEPSCLEDLYELQAAVDALNLALRQLPVDA